MLKHPLECVVTLMSLDIVHPLFLNLNLQWLVTKNTRRELVLQTLFWHEPSCAHIFYFFFFFLFLELHVFRFFYFFLYIYLDLHVSIFFFLLFIT
jgi:hypothetical protein